MTVTIILLIVPSALFINNIALGWGPGVIVPTVLLAAVSLGLFVFTACSDPGIVFKTEVLTDPEDGGPIVPMIECSFCKIQRPRTASHCYDCGVCIDELDHHCPWTGKCIGKKTLKTFRAFLVALWGLIGFVCVFVLVTAIRGDPVFQFTR